MNTIFFHKMQAQGNDFIILDRCTHQLPDIEPALVRMLAHRRLGIGCDQLLVLAEDQDSDAMLIIYNQDGSQAANCGNGLRCVGDYLMKRLHKHRCSIRLQDRIVHIDRTDDNANIRVQMGQASIVASNEHHYDIHIGNAHRVHFDATEELQSDAFNIEIVTGHIADHVWIDIIERGAGRTPACGSGACAVAAAIWHKEDRVFPLTIEMPGGCVRITGNHNNIVLEGSVEHVFIGEYPLRQQKLF